MPNPVGTKGQREELRRAFLDLSEYTSGHLTPEESVIAVKGLDIAERAILAWAVLNWPTELSNAWYRPYELAAWATLNESLAKWDNWQAK